MTTADAPALCELVEDYLFKEAGLLGNLLPDYWGALFTQDTGYAVPTNDLPEGATRGESLLNDDDITLLRATAVRLNSRYAHRSYPWSRTGRLVSSVGVAESENKSAGYVERHGVQVP